MFNVVWGTIVWRQGANQMEQQYSGGLGLPAPERGKTWLLYVETETLPNVGTSQEIYCQKALSI